MGRQAAKIVLVGNSGGDMRMGILTLFGFAVGAGEGALDDSEGDGARGCGMGAPSGALTDTLGISVFCTVRDDVAECALCLRAPGGT